MHDVLSPANYVLEELKEAWNKAQAMLDSEVLSFDEFMKLEGTIVWWKKPPFAQIILYEFEDERGVPVAESSFGMPFALMKAIEEIEKIKEIKRKTSDFRNFE